jgi:guanosine-3',5'-bis(diphosphate) 3'-pyrophosphohydrolase
VAGIVEEVTDTKWLHKGTRKRLQVSRAGRSSSAAKLVKLADKICNLRDLLASPPVEGSIERQREYVDWAKTVIDRVRGANPRLEKRLISCMGGGRKHLPPKMSYAHSVQAVGSFVTPFRGIR